MRRDRSRKESSGKSKEKVREKRIGKMVEKGTGRNLSFNNSLQLNVKHNLLVFELP